MNMQKNDEFIKYDEKLHIYVGRENNKENLTIKNQRKQKRWYNPEAV